jgi:hypothetical protein
MSFQTEPSYSTAVPSAAPSFGQSGHARCADRSAVRRYLKQFLSDPRVVEIPRAVWWFILNLIILPFRSGQSAEVPPSGPGRFAAQGLHGSAGQTAGSALASAATVT